MSKAKSIRIEYGFNSNLQLNDISWVVKLDLIKLVNLCNKDTIQTLKTRTEFVQIGFTKNINKNTKM